MSENKQFEASAKKKKKAEEDGDIPRSRELTQSLQLSVCFLILLFVPFWGHQILDLYHKIIENIDVFSVENLPAFIAESGRVLILVLSIWFIPVMVISLVSELGQVGGIRFSLKHVQLKLDRLDPIKGMQRVLGQREGSKPVVGLLREILQIFLIGFAVIGVLWLRVFADMHILFEVEISDTRQSLFLIRKVVLDLLRDLLILSIAYGIIKYLLSRMRIRKKLMMDFQEMKRENKEDEGDPHLKGQRKSMHQEVLTHGMIENVKKAKVVVVNDA